MLDSFAIDDEAVDVFYDRWSAVDIAIPALTDASKRTSNGRNEIPS
jgi:hypothetical protein